MYKSRALKWCWVRHTSARSRSVRGRPHNRSAASCASHPLANRPCWRPIARYVLRVILSGAFLAEAAATVDNKLNVSGGVLSRFTVGADRLARFVLVVLTKADSGNSDRRVDVEIRPPTLDEPLHRRFDVPEASLGEFPGFAFFDIDVTLPFDGRWVIEVTGGGAGVSLPLVVTGWTLPPPPGI